MPEAEYPWRLPLRRRDGSVRAWALVDEADFEEVSRFRWCLQATGYAVRRKDGKNVFLHRELFGLQRGQAVEVDHINRDKLDNRRANLRVVPKGTQPQNMHGRRVRQSRFRGVTPKPGGWAAQVGMHDEKGIERNHYLGVYALEEDAAAVAAQWRHAHFPFANEDPELLKRTVRRNPRGKRLTDYERSLIQMLWISTTLSRRQMQEMTGITLDTIHRLLGPGTKKARECLLHEPERYPSAISRSARTRYQKRFPRGVAAPSVTAS